MLTRELLLATELPRFVVVDVPEWRGEIGLRVLSAAEFVALRDLRPTDDSPAAIADSYCRFLVQVACDGEGRPLFTAEDLDWLRAQGGLVKRLCDEAQAINCLSDKAAKELEKN